MKFDALCELDKWSKEISLLIWDLEGYAMTYEARQIEQGCGDFTAPDIFDITRIDNMIKRIENEQDEGSGGLSLRIYYELEANLMEAPNKQDVIWFYKNRFKSIFLTIPPSEIQQTIQEGRLSKDDADHLERRYLMLVGCWEIFKEDLEQHINVAIDGDMRKDDSLNKIISDTPKSRRENQSYELPHEIVEALEKLIKHQKEPFVIKEGNKYKWVQRGRKGSDLINVSGLNHLIDSVSVITPQWRQLEKYFGVQGLGTKRTSSARWVKEIDRIIFLPN